MEQKIRYNEANVKVSKDEEVKIYSNSENVTLKYRVT